VIFGSRRDGRQDGSCDRGAVTTAVKRGVALTAAVVTAVTTAAKENNAGRDGLDVTAAVTTGRVSGALVSADVW